MSHGANAIRPAAKLDDGDDVLGLTEELRDQARAPGRLPPGTLQPVLQLAVLEVLEVERGGVLHEPQAGFVAETLRQQGVEQRHGAAQHVGEDRQSEFQREQPADAVEQSARDPLLEVVGGTRCLDQQHHFVDDQLADVERRDRQQRARRPEHGLAEGEGRAGAPDQLQERREVAQRAEPFSPGLDSRRRRRVTG